MLAAQRILGKVRSSIHRCSFLTKNITASTNVLKSAQLGFEVIQPLPKLIHTSTQLLKNKAKNAKKIEVVIEARDAEEFLDLNQVLADMHNAVEKLKDEYIHNFRVGFDLKFLENVTLKVEGMEAKLQEVANIRKKSKKIIELDFVSFPEAIKPATLALQGSSLNLNPSIEGTKVAVPIPVVTADFRKSLAKNAKLKLNVTKEEIRNIRNSYEKKLKALEGVPEDTSLAIRKQIGLYFTATQLEAENVFKSKEKDLLLD